MRRSLFIFTTLVHLIGKYALRDETKDLSPYELSRVQPFLKNMKHNFAGVSPGIISNRNSLWKIAKPFSVCKHSDHVK